MEKSKKTWVFAGVALLTTVIIQMIFTGMIYNPLSVYTAPILNEFPEFSRAQYALAFTIMSAICAVANLFLGKLKSLINTRGVVTLGGILMTVGMFMYSKSTGLAMFYVAATIVGIAFAFLATAICATIINTWFAKHTGMLVGLTVSLAGLGGTIFSPMVGNWIATYGWRHSFMIATIVSAVCTVIMALAFRSDPAGMDLKPLFYEEKENSGEQQAEALYGISFKKGIKTVNFWSIVLAWLIIGITVYSIMGIISVYVQDLGYSAAEAGKALAPMFTVNMIMPFVIGWASDHINIKYLVGIGIALFAVACIILLTNPALGMVYVVACCTGVGLATGRSTLPMITRKVFGTKEYASFIGVFVGVFSGGIAIGNVLIAAIFDKFGSYASAMYIYLPLVVIAILAIILLSGRAIKED
ncbi:MAG: MFS transporter [Candidatus Limivicinus sp.]|nr:MFS transporter [Candidatus Limivicinus sp.]